METNTKKFLEFNGKNVYFMSSKGMWYIAVKPICIALGVDYEAQRKAIHRDQILQRAQSEQTVHDASGRLQKMLCLPEFFIYGWLFQVESASKDLHDFKWNCYELLYNHFHGAITNRSKFLIGKTEKQLRIEKLENELLADPKYKELMEAKAQLKDFDKKLKSLDTEYVNEQLSLWGAENN